MSVTRMSYSLAHAAAWDAGNRSMRAAGRERWNEEDLAVATAEMERLLQAEANQERAEESRSKLRVWEAAVKTEPEAVVERTQLDWLAEHYRGQDPAEADADELADWEAEQGQEDEEEDERC